MVLALDFSGSAPARAPKQVMAENKLQPKGTLGGDAGKQSASAGEEARARSAAPPDPFDAAPPTLHRFRLPKFFTSSSAAANEGEDAADEAAPRPVVPPEPLNGARRAPATASTAPASDLALLHEQMEELASQVRQVNEREGAMEKVFNTLHSELAAYKNDFLYEHLKPVVRPLLFLFDSLEQFDGEVSMAQSSLGQSAQGGVLSPGVVRENVHYFRDQLVEALRVCEVVLMDAPTGNFNSKFHKAVDVVPVGPEEDGKIVRVVRSGWFLNGQLLRPAEVVVGRHRAGH